MTTPALSLADLRKEYTRGGLVESDMAPDPLAQFHKWFEQALRAGVEEPNAMTLATVNAEGQPSVRVILLKGVDRRGFSFFTNYESRKARDLETNPRAALNFFWMPLERQVVVEGRVTRLPRDESEAYFKVRPRGNRLGAWTSRQSQVIAHRAELEEALRRVEEKYPTDDIPTPPYWGGYVLDPGSVEFWQGRPNRLHDRLRYVRAGTGWQLQRLSP